MRIAQVAPVYESVPPKKYGGTERVVSWLTEELVNQGHEVTLFASGDSETSARLVSPIDQALRLNNSSVDHMAPHILTLEQVSRMTDEFDVIHFHLDYLHFPISRLQKWSNVTTLHGKLNIPELKPLYKEFTEMPVVSISNSQREFLPLANWMDTIYHGMPTELLDCVEEQGEYLLFLGRIAPEKGPAKAIEIAIKSGIELKIAAKVDPVDQSYFEEVIKPMTKHPLVDYVGEVDLAGKNKLLGNAKALIFPIDWPEPFGLVMIEAMACGTPTIAFRRGSVPEVIDHGITGFIVDNMEESIEALSRVESFDRKLCRARFEKRFNVERMVSKYLKVYETVQELAGLERTIYSITSGKIELDKEQKLLPNCYETVEAGA